MNFGLPLLTLLPLSSVAPASPPRIPTHQARINRQALVERHNVVIRQLDKQNPIQVGNGEFAFGMDVTGLQSFVPFNTMSYWGWGSLPLPAGTKLSDFQGAVWNTHGRAVRYPLADPNHPAISQWLAGNPHRINLGRLGFTFLKKDGTEASTADLGNIRQTLDLWHGVVNSHFQVDGDDVDVTTACDPDKDQVAVSVKSSLIAEHRLSVFLNCPGDDGLQFANYVGDGGNLVQLDSLPSRVANSAYLLRRNGENSYYARLTWVGHAVFETDKVAADPIRILKAEYGAKDHWLDVTMEVSKAVHDGRISVKADNHLGPDPILGTVKHLRVSYEEHGKTFQKEVTENETLRLGPLGPNRQFFLRPSGPNDSFSFVCSFSPKPIGPDATTATSIIRASAREWPKFWNSGGAVDLSGSKDARWKELERRIVLSQYLMKVNEAGSLPPQESGLVNNGWFGRWHMEMYWWHAAHYALWNRWPELNRSLGIYSKLMPEASKLAKSEGYLGARWPKCIGPNFVEWPFIIHSFLIWQQPHPLYFAELDYRAHPTLETLKKWQPVVEATANFMATYAWQNPKTGYFDLGPPVYLVSENTDPGASVNPTFELGYWRFGLRIASEWRKRLGIAPNPLWARVEQKLAPLPVQDGTYVLHEAVHDMWTKWTFEHPALTGVLGILPGDGVDRVTMKKTFDKVLATWNFNHTWGWDFPMLAMCASRLGETDRAVDLLLTGAPGFQFDPHGLATGGPFPYFPSNGGLLFAIALMSAGWEGDDGQHAPGFPRNGRWDVKFEGLSRAP